MKKLSSALKLTLALFLGTFLHLPLYAVTFEEACNVLNVEKTVTGDFVQKRTVAASGKTLKSTGVFTVSAEKVIWQSQKPVKNTVEITKGIITVTDSKGNSYKLDSSENLIFSLISKMMGSLFAGNKSEMENYFTVEFESKEEAEPNASWKMTLFPKDSTISSVIQKICLSGNKSYMTQMETVQHSGDSLVYELKNHTFLDAAE